MKGGSLQPERWAARALVASAAVVLLALAFVTWHALGIETREVRARQATREQESLRLALWRIDSVMTPILAREAARPYFEYQPFYPADRAYTEFFTEVSAHEVLVPSPLLTTNDALVNLYYQRDGDGAVESPQVPLGAARVTAEGSYLTPYAAATNDSRLVLLEALFKGEKDESITAGVGVGATRGLESADRQKTAPKQSVAPGSEVRADTPGRFEPMALDGLKREQIGAQNRPPADETASNPEADSASVQPSDSSKDSQRSDYQARAAVTKQAQSINRGSNFSQRKDSTVQESETASTRSQQPETAERTGKATSLSLTMHDQSVAPILSPASSRADFARDSLRAGEPSVETVLEDGNDSERLTDSALGLSDLRVTVQQDVVLGDFQAAWVVRGGNTAKAELLFRRSVRIGLREMEQGLWMNWPELQRTLLAPINDLFPDATLRPVTQNVARLPSATLGRMLASIPAELVVPSLSLETGPTWTPLRTALLAMWVLVLLALVGLAIATRAMADLAARRGQFVSAVTHELRTPLTTFRLYSQMLASGMVRDDETRTTYAQTLFSESERLGRIVESVLEYARLGKGEKPRLERLTLAQLRERVLPSLDAIASSHAMKLVQEFETGEGSSGLLLATDPSRIERILVNLVENAGKYARFEDGVVRVIITWEADASSLRIRVRDFGPGISHADISRIFRPFTRGANHAHGNTPGMGLGLALARSLAEQLGGSLTHETANPGATFNLRLPIA